jgi:hypothetical protein
MSVVSDNLRKGAALNAVQIAKLLVDRKLLKEAAQASLEFVLDGCGAGNRFSGRQFQS